MSKQKKLHPVVEAYVRTGKGLKEIIASIPPETRDVVTNALLAVTEAQFGTRPAEKAWALAENAVPVGGDSDLLVLFFSVWGNLAAYGKRIAEATSLLKRARALSREQTPPEVRSWMLVQEAYVLMVGGRTDSAAERLDEALAAISNRSPRYPTVYCSRAQFLAQVGRGCEAEEELDRIVATCDMETGAWLNPRRNMFRLMHCAECGRIEEALRYADPVLLGPLASSGKEMSDNLVILAGVLTGRPATRLPDWAATIGELLANNPGQALRYARRAAAGKEIVHHGWTYHVFSIIRAELGCGQHQAARRLVHLQRQTGQTHYLGDFFLARAELLSGNREEAQRRFAAAYRACQRYRAEKRLEIELRLACEMSRSDVMFLMAATTRLPEKTGGDAALDTQAGPPAATGTARLVGGSPAIEELRRVVARLAPLETPVLVSGETGTGKELVARAIHESGQRSAEPFLAVNCGAITESLLETELFGHERGAFTGAVAAHQGLFEEAGSGTVLLDEVGDMPPKLQVSLLRVLESGEVRPVGRAKSRRIRCRIIAATNADLEALADKGTFRKDLLYRLKRLEVRIPPLRERRDDILPLAEHFLAEGRSDGARPRMSPELQAELRRRDWPGNVRELRNEIERLRLLNSDRTEYGLAELANDGRDPVPVRMPSATETAALPAKLGCTRSSRLDLVRDLFRGRQKINRSEIIRALGVSQTTATTYLKQLCLEGLVDKVEPTASPRTHYFRLRSPPL